MPHWIGIAAIFLGAGVAAGAFGAHALREVIDAHMMSIYEKAVWYQLTHALGLLVVALLPSLQLLSPGEALRVCLALSFGIVVFSGSLYLLVLSGVRMWGAVTPFGGTAFIVAWCMLAFYSLRSH